MHLARDNFHPDVSIFEGANELLSLLNENNEDSLKELLEKYRLLDAE